MDELPTYPFEGLRDFFYKLSYFKIQPVFGKYRASLFLRWAINILLGPLGYLFQVGSNRGYPKVRKGALFAKRTPFREKDLILHEKGPRNR